MNDILTAALWLAAIALGQRHLICGVLIGLAILVRPNLAPLALVLAAMPFIQFGGVASARRALAVMIAGTVPGVAALMVMNRLLYGSTLASGYGDTAALFATAHVGANVTNYGRALWDTQHIVPAIGLIAPAIFAGPRRAGSIFLLVAAAAVCGIYLFYTPFPEWWYLRFLIPAIVILLVLASAVVAHLLLRANMAGLIPIVAVVLGIFGARAAGQHDALALQQLEGRYRQSADLIRDRLPANAVLITEWQSGSVRFHADREVVLWESLDPAWLDRAIAWLKSRGLQPYILVERREEQQFRSRFRAQSELGGLDWPPRFDLNRQVRIFDPDDRARYLAGESYTTEQIGYPRRIQSPRKM